MGHNIEIMEEVGNENIFIFGLNADQVLEKRKGLYRPSEYYFKIKELKSVIDMIEEGYFSQNERELFKPLLSSLLGNDYFMLMSDFQDYSNIQNKISDTYSDKTRWTKMSIVNTANMGKFSTDRTIREYATGIWDVHSLPIRLNKEIEIDE